MQKIYHSCKQTVTICNEQLVDGEFEKNSRGIMYFDSQRPKINFDFRLPTLATIYRSHAYLPI